MVSDDDAPGRFAGVRGELTRWAGGLAADAIVFLARLVTAVRGVWEGAEPRPVRRIYFANHTSNGDFVLVWAVLPGPLRARTRPVAAADYWLTSAPRAFIAKEAINAVLIDRRPETRTDDPVAAMVAALDEGASLILFPEGKRNMGDAPLLEFKSGLYHVARQRPDVELVPAWIENLNRVMPKGEVIPVPLLCTVTFGAPIRIGTGEAKDAFLTRARAALLALAPGEETP